MADTRPRRADARRNYELIVAAAEAEVARVGAEASLEKIARDAGVGSATLHRHFSSRRALLEAVFHDRVAGLCEQARELADRADPGRALVDWLRAVAVYGATTRGLAASLLASARQPADARKRGLSADERGSSRSADERGSSRSADVRGSSLSAGAGEPSPRTEAREPGLPAEAREPSLRKPSPRKPSPSAEAREPKRDPAPPEGSSCEVLLREAGDALLRRAREAGAVRPDVDIDDLLTVVNAVSLATGDGPSAARLVTLAMDGIHPAR